MFFAKATPFIFVVLLIHASISSSSKILSVEFFGSKSHVLIYLPLLEELSRRGHEVTLIGPIPRTQSDKIRIITTVNVHELLENAGVNCYQTSESTINKNPFYILKQKVSEICHNLYNRHDIAPLLDETFDVVILQPFHNDCALGFVHAIMSRNDAPLILFSTTSAPNFIVGLTGGHHPTSFIPSHFTGFGDEMSFVERLKNFGSVLRFSVMHTYYYLPTIEEAYRREVGVDTPNAEYILGSASLILSNGHICMDRPKPNFPDVIDVGGLHTRPANPLPKDFEDFISSGEDGFILFAFGSGVRGVAMPENKLEMFVNVFRKLKQQVIWKFESDKIHNQPKNIKLSNWLPQQDLLGHPKIKMFITHCGHGSIQEAVYNGVPLLGIPFFGDQSHNAREAADNDFLFPLEWSNVSEDTLLHGINEILYNSSYRKNARELSSLFKDQINSPLDRAVWWTEYVIRHKGTQRLHSKAARKLNFVQYHSLDILALLFCITLAAVCCTTMIVKVSYRKFCNLYNAMQHGKLKTN